MAAKLVLDIITDASKAVTGLQQISGATDKASTSADKAKRSFGSVAKAAGIAAGAAALGGLVAVFKTGVDEQSDFLAGQAQLANGLKTTHNAANTTVGQLEDLAGAIQNYSGQSDDSIVSSEKLLLTFTNIGNKAGKNNDIFDQATKLTADMAAKMGGDASKYAIQLGKALNDPTKGLSSLTRVGVSFSEGQTKSIKAMQAAGSTMGAQKIILAELSKEFGGSAKAAGDTLPGQLEKAKRSFEDVSQSVIASLMPILTALAGFLTGTVMPAFSAVVGFITRNGTAFTILAGAIGAVVVAVKIWTISQALLNVVLTANPIALVIVALVAIGAALVIAYQKSETFRKIVQTAFDVVKKAAKIMWDVLRFVFHAIAAVVKFVAAAVRIYILIYIRAFQLLAAAAVAVVRVITRVFHTVTAAIITPFRVAWNWLRTTLIPGLKQGWDTVVATIGRVLRAVTNVITAPFLAAWHFVRDNVIEPLKNGWDTIVGAISRALHGVTNAITAPFEAAWHFIRDNVVEPIKSGFSAAFDAVANIWNGFASFWNGLEISIPGISIPFLPDIPGFTIGLPDLPFFAEGGYVTRATAAVIGEAGPEVVAPEPMLRALIREELGRAGPSIVVNGALDPDAVARQIESLLARRDRRVNGVTRRGAPGLAS